jgi:hypothetical protein
MINFKVMEDDIRVLFDFHSQRCEELSKRDDLIFDLFEVYLYHTRMSGYYLGKLDLLQEVKCKKV